MRHLLKFGKLPWVEQMGITGLETAIVLIAFVVVSSVFAFAALSTGLFTAEKSKETIQAGLAEARGTIELKGSIDLRAVLTVIVDEAAGGSGTAWTLASFPVVPGSEVVTADSAVLTLGPDYNINYDTGAITTTSSKTVVEVDYTKYAVSTADVIVANSAGGAAVDMTPGETLVVFQDADDLENIGNFGLTRLGIFDADNLLEGGEAFQLSINISSGDLTNKDKFTLQIKPPQGAVLVLERRVPDQIDALMNVD